METLNIIIFGANEDGKSCLRQVKPLQWINLINVVAILDNDSRLWGTQIDGVDIVNPSMINKYKFDKIIIAPLFVEEITEQLQSLGVEINKITHYCLNYKDYFGSQDQSKQKLKIGKYSYYKPSTQIWNCEIGNFCHIGGNCLIGLVGHDPTNVTTYPLRYHFSRENIDCSKDSTAPSNKMGNVKILNDVYMGEGIVVMGGVTIGNGSVIGTRSVVNKDVLPYSIVAGVPAKIIRMRFPDHVVDALLKISWWDWNDEKISMNIDTFNSDVEKFISLHLPKI